MTTDVTNSKLAYVSAILASVSYITPDVAQLMDAFIANYQRVFMSQVGAATHRVKTRSDKRLHLSKSHIIPIRNREVSHMFAAANRSQAQPSQSKVIFSNIAPKDVLGQCPIWAYNRRVLIAFGDMI